MSPFISLFSSHLINEQFICNLAFILSALTSFSHILCLMCVRGCAFVWGCVCVCASTCKPTAVTLPFNGPIKQGLIPPLRPEDKLQSLPRDQASLSGCQQNITALSCATQEEMRSFFAWMTPVYSTRLGVCVCVICDFSSLPQYV